MDLTEYYVWTCLIYPLRVFQIILLAEVIGVKLEKSIESSYLKEVIVRIFLNWLGFFSGFLYKFPLPKYVSIGGDQRSILGFTFPRSEFCFFWTYESEMLEDIEAIVV